MNLIIVIDDELQELIRCNRCSSGSSRLHRRRKLRRARQRRLSHTAGLIEGGTRLVTHWSVLSLAQRQKACMRLGSSHDEVVHFAFLCHCSHFSGNCVMAERERVDAVFKQIPLVIKRAEATLLNLNTGSRNSFVNETLYKIRK